MEKVRFTVAISAYNIENYVKRAIDSVLNQTFKNYELLVIDDCSTDSTMEVIKQVVGQNAKILQTKKNSGTAAAYHRAAVECAGSGGIRFNPIFRRGTIQRGDARSP